MRRLIKKIPVVNSIARFLYYSVFSKLKSFSGSDNYWNSRYEAGGNSGAGSYNQLAEFKADVLNQFVKDNQIKSVIEFGCGDGNQLTYMDYPNYIGYDISEKAILLCKKEFSDDQSKQFKLASNYQSEQADLALSLDVIYHLVEDHVYESHMRDLFSASERYVIIYSSNTDQQYRLQAPHVKHRRFESWTEKLSDWRLIEVIPNKYPYNVDETKGSFADFYIFSKTTEK